MKKGTESHKINSSLISFVRSVQVTYLPSGFSVQILLLRRSVSMKTSGKYFFIQKRQYVESKQIN